MGRLLMGFLTDVKNSQPTASEIMRTAGWAPAQFRVYHDLRQGEEAVISSLMRDLERGDGPDQEFEELHNED